MLETIAAAYSGFIGSISNYLYTYILIVLLVAGGIYFTVRTKFVQFRFLPESIRIVMQPSEDQNSISAFKTLMVSTASRVGTGNIAGISTAICLGGTGAVFWMWVTALLGSATAFVEGTLAQIYKKRAKDGSCYGGPAYYIEQALKQRWLGVLFAVVMILTYMVGFNLVASFNIADSLKAYSFYDPTLTPWIVGIVLAVVFLVCISGGGKQIANITAVLVPFMEEFAFRGVVLSALRKYGIGFSIVASALIFGMAHMDFSTVVFAFVAGLVFGFLYAKTNNLWLPVIIHSLNNLIAVLGSHGEFLFGDMAYFVNNLLMLVPLGVGLVALVLLLVFKRGMFIGLRSPRYDGPAQPLGAGESAASIVRAPMFWVVVGLMALYTLSLFFAL